MIIRTWVFLALHVFAAMAMELAPSDRHGTVPGLENCETEKKGQFDAACMDRNAKHILNYVESAPALPREALSTSLPLVLMAFSGAFFVFSSALKSKTLVTFVTVFAAYILLGVVGVFGPIEVMIVLGVSACLLIWDRAVSAQTGSSQKPDRRL